MERKTVAKKKKTEPTEPEESRKKLLLNKPSLEMVTFASKEQSKYHMNSLRVTKDYVEATTGSILVRLSHPKADPDEFPVTPGEPFDKIDFILPIESIKKIKIPAKIYLPILSNACLSREEGMVSISTTDLDTMQTSKIKPIEGEFPDTEQFVGESVGEGGGNEWKVFTLNSDILKVLANYVSRRSGRDDIPITFWVKDSGTPVHFRFKFIDTKQEGRGVLMPMIGVDVRRGFGLTD